MLPLTPTKRLYETFMWRRRETKPRDRKNLCHRFFSGTTRGCGDGGIHHHHVMDDGNKPWRTLWLHGKLVVVFHLWFLLKPSDQFGLFWLSQEKQAYWNTGMRKKWTEINTVQVRGQSLC